MASQPKTNSPEGKRVSAYQTWPIQNSFHVVACDDGAHHASVVVLSGLRVVLLHHTGEAALVG